MKAAIREKLIEMGVEMKDIEPEPPREPQGMVLTAEHVQRMEAIIGQRIQNVDGLFRALERCRMFSIEGRRVTLDSAYLERIRSRAQASRCTPAQWLEVEIKRLLAGELGC